MGLELETSLEPAATTLGDPALIERLIANLIDNAVDHNVPGGRIEVRTATDGGTARSHGRQHRAAAIPPIGRSAVRAVPAARRAPAPRDDGHHGLGLSIVRAIAAAHGADLAAEAVPGGGLAVSVCFTPAE